jgi:tetratricopeptide (TPR) repeat protein
VSQPSPKKTVSKLPVIQLDSPIIDQDTEDDEGWVTTTNKTVNISGSLQNADTLEINGVKIPVSNQRFKYGVSLKKGKNEISVLAKNGIGSSETVLQFIKESPFEPIITSTQKTHTKTESPSSKVLAQFSSKENRQLIDASVQVMKMAYSRVGWKPTTLPEKEQENLFQKTASGILLMQLGMDFFYKRDYLNALSAYQEAAEQLPNFPYIFVRMGSIYYKMADALNAEKYWKKALELDPNYPDLHRYLDNLKNL